MKLKQKTCESEELLKDGFKGLNEAIEKAENIAKKAVSS
jgi:hypothetical protein